MLRFLIAQAFAFGMFGLYKLQRDKPKSPLDPPPPQKIELQQLSPWHHSLRFFFPKSLYPRIPLTLSERVFVLNRDRRTCQLCGRKAPEVVLEIDHIIPVSKGGTNDPSNLQVLCFDCNRGKGVDLLIESSEETVQFLR